MRVPSPPSVAQLEAFSRKAKGLAHPARLAILIRLADGAESTAGDLVRNSGLAQSTVSEHLRVLREAEIVTARHDGPRVWYRLERPALRELWAALDELVN